MPAAVLGCINAMDFTPFFVCYDGTVVDLFSRRLCVWVGVFCVCAWERESRCMLCECGLMRVGVCVGGYIMCVCVGEREWVYAVWV